MTSEIAPDLTVNKLLIRYRDAYRVANIIVGLGKVLKVIGIVLAAVGVIGGIVAVANDGDIVRTGFAINFIVAGVGAWFIFWVWGVIVSSLGQLLRGTLDGAVYSSPFLSDRQRLEAMGI